MIEREIGLTKRFEQKISIERSCSVPALARRLDAILGLEPVGGLLGGDFDPRRHAQHEPGIGEVHRPRNPDHGLALETARAHLVDLDHVIRHAPDLCVEILSPSTEATDRGRKLQMFARYGVPEYWIVDPVNEVIELHRLEAASYVLVQRAASDDEVESSVVPGATLRAGSVFP